MAAHLSALAAIAGLPFGHILGPLVVYLARGHESEFVAEHSKASLNYQITITIVGVIAIVAAAAGTLGYAITLGDRATSDALSSAGIVALWAAIGFAILLIVVLSFIFIILGTLAASEGRLYTYPFAIRFLR